MSGAAWAALAGAANAYTKQRQDATDEQQWQDRYKIMQQSQEDAARARARYMAALEPPKVDSIHTTDESGKPVVQARQWVAPSDEDIKAGKGGHFDVTGSTPDINFERLDETARHNAENEAAAQQRLDLQGRLNEARIDAATARGAAEKGRFQEVKNPDGTSLLGTIGKDGVFHEARTEDGKPLSSAWYRQRGHGMAGGNPKAQTIPLTSGSTFKANAADDIGPAYPASEYEKRPSLKDMPQSQAAPRLTIVDPGAGRPEPLGQFAGGAPKPAANKAPAEGTILYKGGRKYVVKNGVPVPVPA